jgi:hypothetical protein
MKPAWMAVMVWTALARVGFGGQQQQFRNSA